MRSCLLFTQKTSRINGIKHSTFNTKRSTTAAAAAAAVVISMLLHVDLVFPYLS